MALTYVMCLCNVRLRLVLQRIPGTLGGWHKTKPVITACYEDVNHTEMQRWRAGAAFMGTMVTKCWVAPCHL